VRSGRGVVTDADNRCTYISKYWQAFTGRDPEKDLGLGWVEALHPEDRERAARDLIEASKSKTVCRGEYRVRRPNGDYGWLDDYGVPYVHADGSYAGHIGTCMDITQHKAQEQAGILVQDSLVLGQEAERKRVAQELHDHISQRLTIVGLELKEAEQLRRSASPVLEERLSTLQRQVEAISQDIHRISHNLHPSTLGHLGLVSALSGLCREFSEQTHIAVDFTGDLATLPTSPEVGIALYRVTQEGLTNVARHSGSRQARVGLIERSGELRLTIADTGVGFDAQRRASATGLGLVSIQERARMIGAAVQITSTAAQGTTIELRVPLAGGEPGQLRSGRIPSSGE